MFTKKNLLIAILSSLFLTIWYTWGLIAHFDQPLSLSHGDAHQTSFVLKHYIEVFRSGNWPKWGTLPMFYGFPNSLFFTEGFFLQAPFAILFSLFTSNIFLISALIAVITVFISLISAFIYFYYLFKNHFGALAGSLIFVCNPYISARFPDHLLLINLQYIPLILLTIELYILNIKSELCHFDPAQRERNPIQDTVSHLTSGKSIRYLWLFAASSLLQLYGSSIYYTVYLTVFIPLYVIIRSWPYLSFRVPMSIGTRNLFVFSPFIFLLLGALPFITFYRTIASELSFDRTLDQIAMGYSARVSDWFFMWPGSVLYGGLKNIAASWWPQVVRLGIPSEHNLFPGLFISITAALAIFTIVRRIYPSSVVSRSLWRSGTESRGYKLGWTFIIILMLALLLSLGPDVVISDNLKFPGLYRIFYALHPLAQYLRVTTRFAVFVYLALGYLVGLLITRLQSRFLIIIMLLGIILEFSAQPLEFLEVDNETKSAYQKLDQNSEIKVIVDWPMNNRIPQFMPFARSQELDSHYLTWASGFHSKSLLSGYTGHIPEAYFRKAALLVTQFPTPGSLNLLKEWGVDAIVLHANEYANSYDYATVKKALIQQDLPIVAGSNLITIFSLIY